MEQTKKKRIRSVLSVAAGFVLALVCMVSVAVSADDSIRYQGEDYPLNTSGDWQYIVTDEGVIIMGNTTTAPTIIIPSEISGRQVVAVGSTDGWNTVGAFENNSSMQMLSIPSSVRRIDAEAFRNCKGLQQVMISDGVKEVGSHAFADCENLQQIQFKGAVLKTIGESAFENCSHLDRLVLPESVESIGEFAFFKNAALSSIVIPDSVTSIGGGAFAGNSVLAEVVIGNGITELPASGYTGINAGADYYTTGIFELCPALAKVTIGTGVVTIGPDTFAGDGILDLKIPDNVVTIDNGAFYKCGDLKNAVIGDGVKTLGNEVFNGCASLETLSLGTNVRSIGDWAFVENTSLKEVTIPSSVTDLGAASFAFCSSMTNAVIGNGVKALPSGGYHSGLNAGRDYYATGAFEGCSSLTEIRIGDGVTDIGDDAFAGTALLSVVIPDNVVTLGKGVMINCPQLETVKIGKGVTGIGERAFENDPALLSVQIGKGVVSIGDAAFKDCTSLKTLVIPSNVATLGGALCYGCSSLTSVTIGNGVSAIGSCGYESSNYGTDYYASGFFEGCSSLVDVSMGNGITEIGADAFAGTMIKALLLPSKLTSIGNGAFYTDSLKELYFTSAAPTLGKELFKTQTPQMFKLHNVSGYDKWEYIVNDFTPITVKFDMNQSKYPDIFPSFVYDQYMTPEGGYIIEPLDPFSEGYKFMGWYKDPEGTQPWDFMNDKVTANTMIYASWKEFGEIAPDAPGEIGVEDSSGTSVCINWASVDGADSYSVYVNGKLVASNLKDCKYTVTGLEPDSVYEITITAVNAMGESSPSLVKVVQTSDKVYLTGDLSDDGAVTAEDALQVLRFAARLDTPTAVQTEIGDVNRDSQIDANDALEILRYAAHLISSFD